MNHELKRTGLVEYQSATQCGSDDFEVMKLSTAHLISANTLHNALSVQNDADIMAGRQRRWTTHLPMEER